MSATATDTRAEEATRLFRTFYAGPEAREVTHGFCRTCKRPVRCEHCDDEARVGYAWARMEMAMGLVYPSPDRAVFVFEDRDKPADQRRITVEPRPPIRA